MKLSYFSAQTFPKLGPGRSADAKVSMGKNGSFRFNKLAVEMMALKPKTKVSLAQDEEDGANWYFFIDPDNGFELSPHKDKISMQFNHSALVKSFNSVFEFPDGYTRQFLIETEPLVMKGSKTQYWKIIVDGDPAAVGSEQSEANES